MSSCCCLHFGPFRFGLRRRHRDGRLINTSNGKSRKTAHNDRARGERGSRNRTFDKSRRSRPALHALQKGHGLLASELAGEKGTRRSRLANRESVACRFHPERSLSCASFITHRERSRGKTSGCVHLSFSLSLSLFLPLSRYFRIYAETQSATAASQTAIPDTRLYARRRLVG